ncbi:DUF7547 family protein [Halarchaeum salinum]|uniref:Uncharacterized protein n=1 Tax=Halarchaeum salinum TaxID=489912 RepID=A0AAV3SA26_9EURY
MTDDTADDLAARVDALEDAVADLRVARDRRGGRAPRRGPFSFPRPPTPREFVRFAVDDAIPATIALLEAQIRALEALRAALRLVEPGRENAKPPAGRETLDRLDAALTDLRDAVSGDALPENGAARDLLEDARALTADLEAEVEAAREPRREREAGETAGIAVDDADDASEERERRTERVEDELDQLRDEYDADDEADASDGSGGDDA